ncbi:MAG: helix-hairpin-helix domain-containing protein [Nitrososphaeria archaeon]|nr:helix-hairpin-helix domain-containing protein [Nitrososphaeria archaeon]
MVVQETNDADRLEAVVKTILRMFSVDISWVKELDLFQLLVRIILSQKTNRKNVDIALKNFSERFKKIEDIAEADMGVLRDVIRPAGMWRIKAERIREIARQIVRGGISLEEILHLPYDEAFNILTSIKGIGPKTADVFLMIARGEDVLPIDTHIFRVMVRMGFVGTREKYEEVKKKLEYVTPLRMRMRAHLALIEFGRRICRAKNPKCRVCPFSKNCPSSLIGRGRSTRRTITR